MTGPDVRPPADLELDAYLEPFEAAAARGDEPDPADYLPPKTHPKYTAVLGELLRLDLEFAWDRGEVRRVENYADRFPALFADPSVLAAVAGEEYRLRKAAGERPDLSEYKDRLRVDLPNPDEDQTVLLGPGPVWAGKELPRVGEFIPPGFLIRSELGRGAFGRVYLAEQADLAGRLVAVKVSSRLVGEAQTLARLQHTHIVPVYAVHRVGPYQLLVMPFLGSATLADVVSMIRGSGSVPATGRAILTAISSRGGEVPAAPEVVAPQANPAQVEVLVRAPYADAILDFGIALADGLAHAHSRGILHRDLKPANVLLTDEGQPMLLDFNLAADDRSATRTVGGTPRYMAPEQLAALANLSVPVDGRADVYALGLVLHELLTGRLPFPEPAEQKSDMVGAMQADRRHAPAVDLSSPAVSAILRRCLAPAPADRYDSAAELRDDLARHRADRPLARASEPWSRERLQKWSRRHPRLSSGSTVATAAALLLAVVGGAGYSTWRHKAELEAREARAVVRDTLAEVPAAAIDRNAPDFSLHQIRDRSLAALAPYRLTEPGDWREAAPVRRLPPDEVETLRVELASLLFFATEATGRLAAHEPDSGAQQRLTQDALALNARAREMTPDSPVLRLVLDEQHDWLRRQNGETPGPPPVEDRPVSPRSGDRLWAAWADFRNRNYASAAANLEAIVASERHYTAWFYLGVVRLQTGDYDRAAEAFLAASAVAPMTAPDPLLYRGVALLKAARYPVALEAFNQFLERAPNAAYALLNRAIVYFHLGRHDAALADLAAAEQLGESPARVHGLRLQIWRATGENAKVEPEYKRLLNTRPETPDAWTVRAEARLPTDAAGALRDFDAALELEPDYLPALRGKASCLSEGLNRPADAVKVLDRVVQMAGATVEDRSGFAVLLARLGRKADARKHAHACLGPATPPLPLYQAASALALTAETPEDRAEVVAILRRVLKGDVAWAKHMPDDPDLKAVHLDPTFKSLTAAGAVLDGPDRK